MVDFGGSIPFAVVTGVIGALVGGIIGYVTTDSFEGTLNGVAIGATIGLGVGAIAGKLFVGTVFAKSTMVWKAIKAAFITTNTVIVESWQHAEELLRKTYEGIKKTFETPFGKRIVDSLSGKIARESKYGYQGLSAFIKSEIIKDKYLISKGFRIEWHFYWSEISNSGGPSGPLRKALIEAGIKIIGHFKR